MKPLKLSFQGINSFSEQAEIDFERLTGGGLFGIFGKTGSGKSTILDCIMYALFAKTARNQTLREYVNRRCDRAFVDFTFEVLDGGERKKYRIKRSIRINKRGTTDTTAELFELKEDGSYPFDGDVNARLKDIIGVGYEEFSKCIILPQGEFASLVKETRAKRLILVSKLFSLEKYDQSLTFALKARIKEHENSLSNFDGRLSHYEGYTKERLDELKTAQIAQEQAKKDIERRIKDASSEVEKGAELYGIKLRLNGEKEALEELLSKQRDVDKMTLALVKRRAAGEVKRAYKSYFDHKTECENINKRIESEEQKKSEKNEQLKVVSDQNARDRAAEMNVLAGLISELTSSMRLAEEIEVLRVEYKKLSDGTAALKTELSKLNREIEDLEEKITSLKDPDSEIERLFDRLSRSAIGNELKGQMEYFSAKRNELKGFEDSALKAAVAAEIDRKLCEIEGRIALLSADADGAELVSKLNKLRADKQLLSECRSSLENKKAAYIAKKQQFLQKNADLERLATEGEEKSKVLKELSQRAGTDVTSRARLVACIDMKRAESARLDRDRSKYAEEERSIRGQLSKAELTLAAEGEKLSQYKAQLVGLEEAYLAALKDGEFNSLDQALSFALDELQAEEYNKTVEAHSTKLTVCREQIKSLEAALKDSAFDSQKHEQAVTLLSALGEELKRAERAVLLSARDVEECEQKLKEGGQLLKERKVVYDKYALCQRLEGVLKGRALLEFIAEEYLAEITSDAARTLLTLTSGRFDLVYDGEFFVCDNLSCGERRPVSTLSGGETFLVSLSLALALSKAICEKTRRPVEFFFLDEGFGTLDAELTDVVIDSLEKLKSSHFSIGLISHVPELKQRISSKILVTSAGAAEGSRIEIIS